MGYTFGDFQGFLLVRHQHERRPEDYYVELVRDLAGQVVEVHLLDLDVGVVLEQLLACRNIVLIDVDA